MSTIYNEQAEENVLGALLMSNRVLPDVLDQGLLPEHFYRPSHAEIYRAILALDERGQAADSITVTAELERTGKLSVAGGKAAVSTLASQVASVANADLYAGIVVEQATVRRLQTAATLIGEIASGPGEAAEKVANAERALLDAVEVTQKVEAQPLGAEIAEVIQQIADGERPEGLKTGFTELDKLTNGFLPGQLIVLAARPGMGKSILAQNIAEYVAKRGQGVCVFSLEMSREEIGLRLVSSLGRLPLSGLLTGDLTDTDKSKMMSAAAKLAELPIYVADTEEVTMAALRAQVRRLKRQKDIGLLVVDYLQLMLSGKTAENRNIEISQISRGLKMLARELEIPVLAVAQLSRAVEGRSEKRPMLSDLRDSGSIEQDADCVLFIYREDYYDPESTADAEVIVSKQRSGALGKAKLKFIGWRCSFGNTSHESVPHESPADVFPE